MLRWEDDLRAELRKAIEAVQPTGTTILPAAQLFAEAVKVLGGHEQLLAACNFWVKNRPDKPCTPKPAKEAAAAYLQSSVSRVSRKRLRNLMNYLSFFTREFGDLSLHNIEAGALKDFVTNRKWSGKTRNDFLGAVGLLFKEAQLRRWVPEGFNPAKAIGRFKEARSTIGNFEPWEGKQLLERLRLKSADLVPALALWMFAGIRLYEIARLTWPEIDRGLTTGFIELEAAKTKTGEPRSVPVTDKLKVWLALNRKDCGTVMPVFWLTPTKSADDRLSELPRHITRKTGVVWKDNAPRHTCATFRFKVTKDAGAVVQAMGTSLAKFERHYWNKSKFVTDEMAREWFGIYPDGEEKLVSLHVSALAG